MKNGSSSSSIIPHSQFVLAGLRRRIESAIEQRNWAVIPEIDSALMSALSQASDCPERNLPALIREVDAVVAVYRRLMNACDAELGSMVSPS